MEMDFMGLNYKEIEADHMRRFYTYKSSQSNGDRNKTNSAVNKKSGFYTNMFKMFKSRQELMDWVQNTARSLGYVIVTKRSGKKQNGVTDNIYLICDRGGIYKGKKISTRNTCSKKINCPFALVANYRNDLWGLRVKCDKHNHELAPHMEGHAYAMRLSNNETRLVATLTKNDVSPQDILAALKERNANSVSTLKTIYNARQKLRKTTNAGSEDLNNRNSDENQKNDHSSSSETHVPYYACHTSRAPNPLTISYGDTTEVYNDLSPETENFNHSSSSETHVSTNDFNAPRAPNPLTISYEGTTKVYNDLSPETVQAIMLLVEDEARASAVAPRTTTADAAHVNHQPLNPTNLSWVLSGSSAMNSTILTPVFGNQSSGSSSTVDIDQPKGMDYLKQLMQSGFASAPYVLSNSL